MYIGNEINAMIGRMLDDSLLHVILAAYMQEMNNTGCAICE